MQSKALPYVKPTELLISQYLLPFFGDNCKRDSDNAGKSVMLISIVAEMVLISQMMTNRIDAGQ